MVVSQPDILKTDGTLWLAKCHWGTLMMHCSWPIAARRKGSQRPPCSLCHWLAQNRQLLNRWQSGEGAYFVDVRERPPASLFWDGRHKHGPWASALGCWSNRPSPPEQQRDSTHTHTHWRFFLLQHCWLK